MAAKKHTKTKPNDMTLKWMQNIQINTNRLKNVENLLVKVPWRRTCEFVECNVANSDNLSVCGK